MTVYSVTRSRSAFEKLTECGKDSRFNAFSVQANKMRVPKVLTYDQLQDRCMDDITNFFVSTSYKITRVNVAVRPFSN